MKRLTIGLLGLAMTGTAVLAACSGSDSGSSGSSLPVINDTSLRAKMATANAGTPQVIFNDSEALVELGRALFYDKILSGDQNISCATCHHTTAFGGDDLPLSIGTGGSGTASARMPSSMEHFESHEMIPRNAPTIFNLGVSDAPLMFLDGRVRELPDGSFQTPQAALNGLFPPRDDIVAALDSALAAQAMFPVTSRDEMRGQLGANEVASASNNILQWEALMARLVGTNNGTQGGIAEYRQMFQAAFPNVQNFDDFNFGHAATAMAAFERDAYTSLNTPYDQYLAGDDSALTAAEKRGADLFFGEAGCADCHNGTHLTDSGFHNLAMPQLGPGKEDLIDHDDEGLALRTNNRADAYKFRTYPLRNVAVTGPWGHAGAYTSLRGIVEHHLDPATAARNYDVNQLPPLYRPYYNDNATFIEARIANLSPLVSTPKDLSEQQIDDLVAFLNALTDQSMVNSLPDIVPDSVPSGLPVED